MDAGRTYTRAQPKTTLETTEVRVPKHEKSGRRKQMDKNGAQWQYSVDALCLSQKQQKVIVNIV
jgi:hypothetical protein